MAVKLNLGDWNGIFAVPNSVVDKHIKIAGGAQVSTKHANFIVNIGGATGNDIKCLIDDIKDKVKEKYNIELKVEQEFVE